MKLCTPRFKKPYIELESKEDILEWKLYKSKEDQDELVEIIEYKNNIINKAIEYIEQQRLHKFQDTTGGLTYNERKLLDILKGVDKE